MIVPGSIRSAVAGWRAARWQRAFLLGLAAATAAGSSTPALRADEPPAEAMAHANALSRAFRYAAERATPSVVVVRSAVQAKRQPGGGQRRNNQPNNQENPFKGTPFEDFFRDGVPEGFQFGPDGPMPGPGGRGRSGVGSGVIVDAKGIVLTNNHVVEGADVVTVELSDGREFKAAEIKTDPASDLAVIRLADADSLPVAKLGNSDDLDIGDWVIAIGNPFELETTVSAGIISAKGRELDNVRRAKFLQTDAAINPGNSGGALVDVNGHLMGINTAIYSRSGGSMGIGFAIPVSTAKQVLEGIVKEGVVTRGWIGVEPAELSPELMETFGVKAKKGVLITGVLQNGPAAQAGIRPGDVIVDVAGKEIGAVSELLTSVASLKPGTPAKLRVQRRDENVEVTLTPGKRPKPRAVPRPQQQPLPEGR
jgi:Do/DeqQ family serine protease